MVKNCNMKSIGVKLKRLRNTSGYTQKCIADFLGISQPLYSQYEKGNRNIRLEYLEKLCNLYCFTLEDFLESDVEFLDNVLKKYYGVD